MNELGFHGDILDVVAVAGLEPQPSGEALCSVYVVTPEVGLCRFSTAVLSRSLNQYLLLRSHLSCMSSRSVTN